MLGAALYVAGATEASAWLDNGGELQAIVLVALSLALGLLALPIWAKVGLTMLAVLVHTSVEVNFGPFGAPEDAIGLLILWAGLFLLPMLIGSSLAAAVGLMRAG